MTQVGLKDLRVDEGYEKMLGGEDASSSSAISAFNSSTPIILCSGSYSSTVSVTIDDELASYSSESKAKIFRGLDQAGTIDRGSFAKYAD